MMFERFNETEKVVTLPFSGNAYRVTIDGEIYDSHDTKIFSFLDSDEESVVELNWFSGKDVYKLAFVVAMSFKPLSVHLPMKYWSELTVLFLDGNNTNLHPSNLVWKFPIGLGSKDHCGFAFVPMYSRYMVNRDGCMFDRLLNKIVKPHYNKGYFSFPVRPDIGPRTCLKRHRAVCLAFTDYPENVDFLQVNHINGRPGEDQLENLEWVTPSENRQHAIDNNLTLANKPVLAFNIKTGEELEFNSITEVCSEFKLSETKVSKYLNTDEEILNQGDWTFSFKFQEHRQTVSNKCPILVRDLKTKNITEFESIVDCAKRLGLTKDVVAWRINTPTSRLQADYLQFKRKSDPVDWYDPVDLVQETVNRAWHKVVLMRNAITGEVQEFSNQRAVAKYLNVCEARLFQMVNKKGQPVFKNKQTGTYFQLKLLSDTSEWRISENPEEEYKKSLANKEVLVKNTKTNQVFEFESAKKCSEAFGILTTTLNNRLKSRGQKIYPDGLQFKYKEDEISFLVADEFLVSLISSAPCSRNATSKLL
jgi:DNA-binding transcriptional regulator YiaG